MIIRLYAIQFLFEKAEWIIFQSRNTRSAMQKNKAALMLRRDETKEADIKTSL